MNHKQKDSAEKNLDLHDSRNNVFLRPSIPSTEEHRGNIAALSAQFKGNHVALFHHNDKLVPGIEPGKRSDVSRQVAEYQKENPDEPQIAVYYFDDQNIDPDY